MMQRQTIFALTTAPGRAAVAVVRVSGPDARNCANTLTKKNDFVPRATRVLTLFRPDGEVLDTALLLWFEGPTSFTGEDIVEFHVHGGRAVVEALCEALASVPNVRPAEPGEFTRRAVENGKLDLTQAEAIADLVDAETESQRKQAVRQYDGALSGLIEDMRAKLVHALAFVEAAIDFADEELPEETLEQGRGLAADVRGSVAAHLADRHGELIRDGLQVAIIGPPNAGKSSLLNALAKREVAIVTATPGTTRDVIEVRLNLDGYAVVLADTAGLRDPAEAIEAEGVRRALARAADADMVLWLRDGSSDEKPSILPENIVSKPLLTVWNKTDLSWPAPREGLRISAKTGEGMAGLVTAIAAQAKAMLGGTGVPFTRPRHRFALEEALTALTRAEAATEAELFAEDVRLALRALGRVVGTVDIEEVLDVVFRDFCIGK